MARDEAKTMKLAVAKYFLTRLCIPISFALSAVAAQDTVKPKNKDAKPATKEEKVEGDKGGVKDTTYLDVVHSREKAMKLKEENMHDIQLLNLLATAMPEAVNKSDIDKIATEYKDGLKQIYRMEYVGAEKTLRANRDSIWVAMGKACEAYRKKTGEMLNESADRMADLDMQAENSGSADSIRMAGIVQKNTHRLSVGYQQLTLASLAEKHRRYNEALSHYRLARLHSIYLKIELAKDDAEKNKLRAQYRSELDEKQVSKEEKADKKEAGNATAASEKPAASK